MNGKQRVVYGFTVEKDVPIPPPTARQGHNIALLKALQPGESIYFDAPIAKRAVRFYRVAKKLDIEVMIRKDSGGMRLWRLPDLSPAERAERAAKAVLKPVRKSATNGKGKNGKKPKKQPVFTAKTHAKRQAAKVPAKGSRAKVTA